MTIVRPLSNSVERFRTTFHLQTASDPRRINEPTSLLPPPLLPRYAQLASLFGGKTLDIARRKVGLVVLDVGGRGRTRCMRLSERRWVCHGCVAEGVVYCPCMSVRDVSFLERAIGRPRIAVGPRPFATPRSRRPTCTAYEKQEKSQAYRPSRSYSAHA